MLKTKVTLAKTLFSLALLLCSANLAFATQVFEDNSHISSIVFIGKDKQGNAYIKSSIKPKNNALIYAGNAINITSKEAIIETKITSNAAKKTISIGDGNVEQFVFDRGFTSLSRLSGFSDAINNGIGLVFEYRICHEKTCKLYTLEDKITKETYENIKIIDVKWQNSVGVWYFIKIFAIAVLGGFVLNLMPCVLPVLSIKLLSIIKTSVNSDVKKVMLYNSFGIVSFFSIFGLVVSCFSVGWGFYFSNKYFILSLCFLMVFIFASSAGYVNVNVASIPFIGKFLSSKLNSNGKSESGLFSFFTGFFVSVVASSCLAPFITTAVVAAVSFGSVLLCVIIFCGIGIGMSIPYLVLSVRPSLVSFIPRSGIWNVRLKSFLSALVFSTVIWLFYVLMNQIGYFYGTLVTLFGAVSFFVLKNNNGAKKLIFFLLIFVFALGFVWYQSITDIKVKAMNNELWEDFSRQRFESYIKDGKNIFVDITADWCITCKVNNFFVLNTEDTLMFFKQNNIKMLKGDITVSNPEVSNFLKQRDVRGIPLYLVYNNKTGQVTSLPTLISLNLIKDSFEANN